MTLKQLFYKLNNTLNNNITNPHRQILQLLRLYKHSDSQNYYDWKCKIKHQNLWFNNPFKEITNIETPVFYNESPYFNMYIIGYPKLYSTKIQSYKNKHCYFKVLQGSVTEIKYNVNDLSYNNSNITDIGYIKNNEHYSIKNNLHVPSYTLNIYTNIDKIKNMNQYSIKKCIKDNN